MAKVKGFPNAGHQVQVKDAPVSNDGFTVDLLGVPVHCPTLEDAVAVKTANDIFTGADHTPYKLDVVLPFIRTLARYGRHDEAKRLSAMFH